jgi:hypothetical protein
MTNKPRNITATWPEQDIADRIAECGFDLEPGFLLLMDKAAEAGWTRAEIAIAIASLAENYVLGRAARECH